MSRPGKIIVGFFSTVVVLVIVVVVAVLLNLNRGLKYAVEHYGPSVTGTPVNLDKVDVSLLSGKAELHGLKIGNPPGFDSGYAFKLNDVKVDLVPKSVTSDTIIVSKLLVDGASLNAQFKGLKSNLQQILDNVKKSSGSSTQEQPAGKTAPGKKFIVKEFRFTGGEVIASSDIANTQRTAQIPAVEVHDVGNAAGGVTIAQLTEQLLRPVIAKAIENAKAQALQQGAEQIKQKAQENLQEKVKKLIE
ncbi:MAG TPA: AsmA family protein [Nitrococcus sp.]|nr:AsmA family protein [Nitrococcus sp.]